MEGGNRKTYDDSRDPQHALVNMRSLDVPLHPATRGLMQR
jgi:hypothetical protein